MKSTHIAGYYGNRPNPADIFILEMNGGTWYAVEGSQNVNFTYEEIKEGINVESIVDAEGFHADVEIDGNEVFENEVDDYING